MKKIIFLLLIIGSVSACKKESKCALAVCNYGTCDENTGTCICTGGYTGTNCNVPPAYCASHHTGSVIVNTTRTDEYRIYINSSLVGTQYGTTTYSNISSGYVTIDEYQVNYIFTQNHYTQGGTLSECGILTTSY